MCQVIKKYFGFFAVWSAILILQGCILHSAIGPGYAVDVRVQNNVRVSGLDIQRLQELAVKLDFAKQQEVALSEHERGIYYDIKLNEKKFDNLRYKFITLVLSYNIIPDADDSYGELQISVYNHWEGYDVPLREEIDRIAQLFYQEVENIVGLGNLTMETMRTGPPF